MTTSENLYIWIYLPDNVLPVVAGHLQINERAGTAAGQVGTFVYGRSYLARKDAIAIDPMTLPLKSGPHTFTTLKGFPGAILDACPDRWGIKVINRLLGVRKYPVGYMLLNDPGRAGNLAFSSTLTRPPEELASREYPLSALLAAAEDLEAGRSINPELLKALHPGTGGARPKCNILMDDAIWIAKFPSIEDTPLISIPRLEHAVMSLARNCGINAAETRIEQIGNRDVCLVKRFDRTVDAESGSVTRSGFLSARSIFYADQGYSAVAAGSYARLARWMPLYGARPEDSLELFRRMVFNCAVRNTDDHDLNHGLVRTAADRFELSPAYDIVPTLSPHKVHHHALLIGDSAAGTLESIRNVAPAFKLTAQEAIDIAHEVAAQIAEKWRDTFYEAGFGDEEIRRIDRVFLPIPKRNEDCEEYLIIPAAIPSTPQRAPWPSVR